MAAFPSASHSQTVVWGSSAFLKPSSLTSLTDIAQVSVGSNHVAAIRRDGSVIMVGDNFYNQQIKPAGLTSAIQIASGYDHSLAIASNGTIFAWGLNSDGQCNVPAGLPTAIRVCGGLRHSIAILSNGLLAAWGFNGKGECNVPAGLGPVAQIAAGAYHSLALRTNGTVAAWGDNSHGQCSVPAGLSNVTSIAAGNDHSLALRADGTLSAWGLNQFGQCDIPASATNVVRIAAGANHCVALRADGVLITWGRNDYGQCNVPIGLTQVSAISAMHGNCLVLTAGGQISITPGLITAGSGEVVTGRVWRNDPAPIGGLFVNLVNSNPGVAAVDGWVIIPEGAFGATFTVNPVVPNTDTYTDITAQFSEGNSLSARLTVQNYLAGLTVMPGSVVGGVGSPLSGTITLAHPAPAGGIVIGLTSSTPVLTVPSTVAIAAGATTAAFTVSHTTTTTKQTGIISATFTGKTVQAAVLCLPQLAGIAVSPATITGGSSTLLKATITLSSAAPAAGSTVTLSCDNSAIGVPISVTIPKGKTTAVVPLTHVPVSADTPVIISAQFLGATQTASVTVRPFLLSINASPASIKGGLTSTGTVTLTAPAPVGGLVVNLNSSDALATVPSSKVIAAGAKTGTFPVTTLTTTAAKSVLISALLNGKVVNVSLTVKK